MISNLPIEVRKLTFIKKLSNTQKYKNVKVKRKKIKKQDWRHNNVNNLISLLLLRNRSAISTQKRKEMRLSNITKPRSKQKCAETGSSQVTAFLKTHVLLRMENRNF
mgnify:CR=1 FL=1